MSTKRNTILSQAIRTALTAGLLLGAVSTSAFADGFAAGNLIVSETDYVGTASTVTVGQNLSAKTFNADGTVKTYNTATNDGAFSNVFKNEVPDPSFGVTSPIKLLQLTGSGQLVSTMAIDSSKINTSFASKSELALNISTDGKSVSFMGYAAPVNALDVSNSNTTQAFDSTNPVTTTYQRAIANVDLSSGNLAVTDVNAYSGNNGRAAVLANGQYYMVGNAGNGSGNAAQLSALSDNTGVQTISATNPGNGNTTVIGAATGPVSGTGYQHGFSLAQLQDPTKAAGVLYAADKTGKDDNFRGMTVSSDGTMYVTKGSGSNGVDTVYQVGATGALANGGQIAANAPITVVAGFNAVSEKVIEAASGAVATANAAVTTFNTANAVGISNGLVAAETYQTTAASEHPFGIWVANATTMFVADEGDGVRTDAVDILNKNTTNAGLQEWTLSGGNWHLNHIFQIGLVGQIDTAASTALGWSVQEDGLRNIAGTTNADGSFTIYGTTSTVSNEVNHDLGADPNQIVAINIGAGSTAANTAFTVLQTAVAGQRFGGVAVAPVPLPSSLLMMLSGLGITGLFARRNKRA